MIHITANTAKREFENILDNVTLHNEPVTIVADDNRVAVLVSMDEWSDIQETLYIQSIPGLVQSIISAKNESIENLLDSSELKYDL